jgi:hypothetical protein
MTSRDDIDGYIFFGTETENFPFPPVPEDKLERAIKDFGEEDVDRAYFIDRLDDSELYEQGVRWYKMNAYHEHDDEKDYIGVQIAENCNCYGHATELTDLLVMVRQAELKWKQLFPDTPGRLFLITEMG